MVSRRSEPTGCFCAASQAKETSWPPGDEFGLPTAALAPLAFTLPTPPLLIPELPAPPKMAGVAPFPASGLPAWLPQESASAAPSKVDIASELLESPRQFATGPGGRGGLPFILGRMTREPARTGQELLLATT